MDAINIFTENLFSFARMLGAKFGGGTLSGPSGSIAAASGLAYAGENYLLLRPGASVFETEQLIGFFTVKDLPFTAPELPGTLSRLITAMEAKCVLPVRTYTAMTIDLPTTDYYESLLERVRGNADEWGRVVWEGFGGGPKVPEEYLALASHFAGCQQNALYLLKERKQALSCGLLHQTENSCGLYYFATPPAFRRHGYARRLMKGLAGEAAQRSGSMVLLATPEGLPFYQDFGFSALAQIIMRSNSPEL